MHALILAAGRGTRLGLPDGQPKCLASVGGRPLITRYLDALDAIEMPATIVVGHGAEHVAATVSTRRRPPTLVFNPDYQLGSIVSLQCGLAGVVGDLLLMDGDVAFGEPLLRSFLSSATPAQCRLLIDFSSRFTDEQYMAGVVEDRVRALKRGPVPGHDAEGEWVGFALLSAAAVADLSLLVTRQTSAGMTATGYEDALASLLDTHVVASIPTNGEPWTEIDFPADLVRAQQLFDATA